MEFIVYTVNLAEDRCFGRQQTIGKFETLAKPVLRIHDVTVAGSL